MVAGKRRRISSVTGCWVLIEVPKSRCTTEFEVRAVLHVERPVQPVRLPAPPPARCGVDALAEQGRLGSAGQRPDEHEDQDRQADQDRDEQQQAADDELRSTGVTQPIETLEKSSRLTGLGT